MKVRETNKSRENCNKNRKLMITRMIILVKRKPNLEQDNQTCEGKLECNLREK